MDPANGKGGDGGAAGDCRRIGQRVTRSPARLSRSAEDPAVRRGSVRGAPAFQGLFDDGELSDVVGRWVTQGRLSKLAEAGPREFRLIGHRSRAMTVAGWFPSPPIRSPVSVTGCLASPKPANCVSESALVLRPVLAGRAADCEAMQRTALRCWFSTAGCFRLRTSGVPLCSVPSLTSAHSMAGRRASLTIGHTDCRQRKVSRHSSK